VFGTKKYILYLVSVSFSYEILREISFPISERLYCNFLSEVLVCASVQVLCEVEMKRMCLSQANADLAEAAEKLEAIRKKLAVSLSFYLLLCR